MAKPISSLHQQLGQELWVSSGVSEGIAAAVSDRHCGRLARRSRMLPAGQSFLPRSGARLWFIHLEPGRGATRPCLQPHGNGEEGRRRPSHLPKDVTARLSGASHVIRKGPWKLLPRHRGERRFLGPLELMTELLGGQPVLCCALQATGRCPRRTRETHPSGWPGQVYV